MNPPMKKCIAALAALFIFSVVYAQGVKVQITPNTSVVFPAQPEKREQGHMTQYSLAHKDSFVLYTVLVVDHDPDGGYKGNGRSAAEEDDSFFDQSEVAFRRLLGTDARMIRREARTIYGKHAVYMEMERYMDGKQTLLSVLLLIESKYRISMMHMDNSPDGDPDKKKFFSSLTIAGPGKK